MADFIAWPKTPRLFRDITVTEKIDGTNACVIFEVESDGRVITSAQSRKRLITPESDNYGFAKWVYKNSEELFKVLGPGRHYGEWWGKGIQRGYGLETKVFSLFNTHKHKDLNTVIDGVPVRPVPVLYQGPFSERMILNYLYDLKDNGSEAAPWFEDPEGICVYHSQSKQVYKVTLDGNDKGKWEL